MKNILKRVNWQPKRIKVKSYEEMQNECQEILQWQKCSNPNCDVDSNMVDDFLMSGIAEKFESKEDSSCSNCNGLGLEKKDCEFLL